LVGAQEMHGAAPAAGATDIGPASPLGYLDPKPEWPSLDPIVLGQPIPDFEPREVHAKHRRTPYRPDATLDGWSNEWFVVRAASLRGYLHRYNGAPRQDDFAIQVRDDPRQMIVAVADGVSGAPQSHIGSTIAVRYALQWLDASMPVDVSETDWIALAQNTAWALVEQASSLFGVDTTAEAAEELVATTLVCAVVEAQDDGSAVAHIVGIGDSGAWLVNADAFLSIAGGKDGGGNGISSSAVRGLPRVPAELSAASVHIKPDEVLLLGSDGFGDPLGSGKGEVGRMFREAFVGRVPGLYEFAHKLDFSKETFDDDRTLIAVWPGVSPHRPGA